MHSFIYRSRGADLDLVLLCCERDIFVCPRIWRFTHSLIHSCLLSFIQLFSPSVGVHSFIYLLAQVDLCDFTKRTPLWAAASFGHADTIRVLLAANADINLRDSVRPLPRFCPPPPPFFAGGPEGNEGARDCGGGSVVGSVR